MNETIKTKAQELYPIESKANEYTAFLQGAKEMIDKACEWLGNTDMTNFEELEDDGNYYFSYGEFIERFKEAMGYENS